MTTTIIVLVAIICVIILFFNQIVREENAAKNAFSTVDVYLKKRYDVIPNLVETVKGHAKHESEVFEKVAQSRAKAMQAEKQNDIVEKDNELNSALKSLLMVAEEYPNLKTNQSYLELQKNLLLIEDELAAARRTYNAAATEYNTTLESFPTNIVGKLANKKQMTLFTTTDDVRAAISVKL